ncbi:hypothetical protein HanIR_Chr03g0114691 [Helianthus annuus]|nr:hypothetical protein HanIR_Chr03g0114691 [Helianthus annuus]
MRLPVLAFLALIPFSVQVQALGDARISRTIALIPTCKTPKSGCLCNTHKNKNKEIKITT